MFTRALGHCVASTIFTTRTRGQLRGDKEWPFCGVTNASRVWRKGAGKRGLKAPLGWRGDMSQSEYAHLMFTYSSNNDTDVHGSSWRLSLLIYVSVCSFQCLFFCLLAPMQASAAGLPAGSVLRFWTRLPPSASTVTKVCPGSVTPGPLPREVPRMRRQFMDLYPQSMLVGSTAVQRSLSL